MARRTQSRRPPRQAPGAPGRPAGAQESWPTKRWQQGLILACGWLLPQFVLLGPSLVGQAVFSPVDLLALNSFYLPDTAEYAHVVPRDHVLSDLITVSPAAREFCAREFRAGRVPLWQPDNFAGAPFASWPKYSLFEWPYYLLPSPYTLAWMQLLQVLCSGIGMWLFLKLRLGLSFWPAAIGGWAASLSGFFSLWQGYPVTGPVCWLPWLLFFAAGSLERPWGANSVGVALVTAALLYCGQSDIGGLVLLTVGLYVLWRLGAALFHDRDRSGMLHRAIALAVAWAIGFLLAAPYLLPLFEHVATGSRMHDRAAGAEDRPPKGWEALPAIILPEIYGSTRVGSQRIVANNLLESSSAGFAGMLSVLWLAPLAWCDRGRRREVIFWTLMAGLALAWVLNVPLLVQAMRVPPLNMFSFNRWTFAAATAVTVVATIGLERLLTAPLSFRWWFLAPIVVAAGFALWCALAAVSLPDWVQQGIKGKQFGNVARGFSWYYAGGAVLAFATLGCWWATFRGWRGRAWAAPAVAILLIGDLTWFSARQDRQSAPELYFPRIAALEQLAKLPAGRLWGMGALPPNLNQSHRLRDIRGYDAIDSTDFLRLFELARDADFKSLSYARTQFAIPRIGIRDERVRLAPVADLLNVRYVLMRTPPPGKRQVVVAVDDYWIIENLDVLPRVFVPRSTRVVDSREAALQAMSRNDFDPAGVAYITQRLDVPAQMQGTARLQSETPGYLAIEADMSTAGLVVLSDLWDSGWHARLNGRDCPLVQVDYALRGVVVPPGSHTIEMEYAPGSFARGLRLAGVGALAITCWMAALIHAARRRIEWFGFARNSAQ